MDITVEFQKHFSRWFVNDLLRAIKNYSMLEQNENLCVALSGGKDSVTLLYIMVYLNKYTNLKIRLSAAHVKTASYDTSVLKDLCDSLEVPYLETALRDQIPKTRCPCSACARLKRGALSDLLFSAGPGKIAFGHHADDVAETFFMNIVNSRKLGSFSPVVKAPGCNMSIIRPMIYLNENRIRHIHSSLRLPVLKFICPYSQVNSRAEVKRLLSHFKANLTKSNFSDLLVQPLENIDMSNNWPSLMTKKSTMQS